MEGSIGSRAVHTIGPYRFTEQDARRTVDNLPFLWEQLALGRDAAVLAPLLPATTGDLTSDLTAVWSALLAAGPALRAAGQLPTRAEGVVAQVSISDGGVPKVAVDRVDIGFGGIVGDVQATRVHHGRPWQALCLWSSEVIAAFAAQGHPLAPGTAGENVTISGLDWADVRPGVQMQLGTVRCEVLAFALPCSKNARWFSGGEYDVMHHERGPVSRVYARVVAPGELHAGDAVVLEP